jgi:hypothetical protein
MDSASRPTLGFIRLMTHRAVLVTPLPAERVISHIRSCHMRPNVSVLEPGPRHLRWYFEQRADAG